MIPDPPVSAEFDFSVALNFEDDEPEASLEPTRKRNRTAAAEPAPAVTPPAKPVRPFWFLLYPLTNLWFAPSQGHS